MNAVAQRTAAVGKWATSVVDFVQSAVAEMKKVTWPTREELVKATRMIIVLSLALGVVIGLMDWLLNALLVQGVARLTR